MNLKNFWFFVIWFFISGRIFGQDLIIQKNGDKIYCKIIQEDSIAILYNKPNQKTYFEIKKSEVEKYYVSKAENRATEIKQESEIFLLNLCFGVASPIDVFGSKNSESESSGLANTGFVFHSSGVLKVSDNFGFGLSYIYQSNKFDNAVINQQYNLAFTNTNFIVESTPWKIKGLFGGMFFYFPIKSIDGLSFSFDISGGLPKSASPQIAITGAPFGQTVKVTQSSIVSRAGGVLGGLGFKYKIAKNILLNINANCLYTKPSFSNVIIKSSLGYVGYTSFSQKISSINICGGLTFSIHQSSHKTRH